MVFVGIVLLSFLSLRGFFILQERVLKCLELIRDLSLIKACAANLGSNKSAPFVPQSPIGVLDAGCLSSKSSDELTVGSCPNSSHNSLNITKRNNKSDGPSSNGTSES